MKVLAVSNRVVESSQATPPPSEGIIESSEVMKIHSDWRTPLMVYPRTGGLPEGRSNVNDCVDGQDNTP
jgi:hypothetical protein